LVELFVSASTPPLRRVKRSTIELAESRRMRTPREARPPGKKNFIASVQFADPLDGRMSVKPMWITTSFAEINRRRATRDMIPHASSIVPVG
jgi:hypothetical protein